MCQGENSQVAEKQSFVGQDVCQGTTLAFSPEGAERARAVESCRKKLKTNHFRSPKAKAQRPGLRRSTCWQTYRRWLCSSVIPRSGPGVRWLLASVCCAANAAVYAACYGVTLAGEIPGLGSDSRAFAKTRPGAPWIRGKKILTFRLTSALRLPKIHYRLRIYQAPQPLSSWTPAISGRKDLCN